MKKIKILVVNEFSQLSTGFSTYMKELIPRLLRNPNFEVAEHACYINESYIIPDNVTWKVYPNEPHPTNKAQNDKFGQNRINQFGRFRFDEVCLDFQPDIVISIRDYWMDKFIEDSVFRKNFKWIHMPTVDGEPQKEEWLETYGQCDLLLTYSLWAKNLLESQSGGKIKVFDVASPCTDLELFHVPEDRKIPKKNFGLNSDLFLIMTVMRNQPRKLFPQLMESFVLYLEKLKAKGLHDLAAKSFLYCHTSYPDVGWELSEEVKRHKLSHKVIFTYTCNACQIVFPSFFNGEICHCRNCGNHAARFPNTGQGISREALAKVMQCADLYVQYSVCEGFGMCANDAKACGTPCLLVDYSAMTEQAYNGGGIPIKLLGYLREPISQTNQYRSVPDNEDLAQKLFDLATDPKRLAKLSKEARACVEKYYNWDMTAKVWENAILSCKLPSQDKTWFAPPQITQPNLEIPNLPTNEMFVEWCFNNILRDPSKAFSNFANKLVSCLNAGYEMSMDEGGRPVTIPIDRQKVLNQLLNSINQKNSLEILRYQKLVEKSVGIPKEVNFVEI